MPICIGFGFIGSTEYASPGGYVPPAPSSDAILTEAGENIVTENGDKIIQES